MSGGPSDGLAHSVKQRLLNLSAKRGETFNVLLVRYGIERLLYRLTKSTHADAFVLKGAMLFAIWAEKPPSVSMMMRHSPSLQTIRATRNVRHADQPRQHA